MIWLDEFVDKEEDSQTKKKRTHICRYSYGLSTPEDLVSDLVNNEIAKECVLGEVAGVFDNWLTKYLILEMKKLQSPKEDDNREVLEKSMWIVY